MKKNIIVIHGFNSGPGRKSENLSKAFPEIVVITPKLSNDPVEATNTLGNIVKSLDNEIHIVGTSLGAFYGMYLSYKFKERDNLYFYYINPSWDPFITLSNLKVDSFLDNLYPVEKESYLYKLRVLKSQIIEFGDKRPTILNNSTFFFGRNDEVLNFDRLKEYLYAFNQPVNIVETNENHRHQDLSEVVKAIKTNMLM